MASPLIRTVGVAVLAMTCAATTAHAQEPLLVDAAWLAQHLTDRNLVVLHVEDEADFKAGHIPGARFIRMADVAAAGSALTLELPAPDELRRRLEAFGISDASRIVLYHGRNGGLPSTTRIILSLDYLGLGGQTSLLNGGLPAWTRAGQRVTPEVPAVTRGTLSARPTKPVVVDAGFVSSLASRPAHTLVDGRAPVFYTGVSETFGKSGHITGAVNIPFTQILDANLMVDRARIEGLFRGAGVKPGDTVVAYCHIGQQGTAVVFAARLLGHNVVLYDGSMQDWATNSRGPVIK